jgi:transcriptional regulator GlxA family with amidase domain
VPKTSSNVPIEVCVFLFDGIQPIDLAGPWQAFSTANELSGFNRYALTTCAKSPWVTSADGGLKFSAQQALLDAIPNPPHTLIVPGGPGIHECKKDPEVLRWLAMMDCQTKRTCSVCTGAFLLAAAGLLANRQVTTHWRSARLLQKEHPAVLVDEDHLFCESGKYWTSAGVTAGIDLALALIERDAGRVMAQRVARRLVVYVRRHGGQKQYSEVARVQDSAHEPFVRLLSVMEANIDADWTIEAMSDLCHMSRRTFQRRFVESFGEPPMVTLRRMREERASLVRSGGKLSLKQVNRFTHAGR